MAKFLFTPLKPKSGTPFLRLNIRDPVKVLGFLFVALTYQPKRFLCPFLLEFFRSHRVAQGASSTGTSLYNGLTSWKAFVSLFFGTAAAILFKSWFL